MLNLIVLLILLISFLGMVVIVRNKIPVLVELSPPKVKKTKILKKTMARVKNNVFLETLAPETLLQKILSKFRILTLKTESKTADWLRELRKKSIEKRKSFKDDYWKKIKKED